MTSFHRPASTMRRRSAERRAAFLAGCPAGMRPKDFPKGIIARHRAIESSAARARAVFDSGELPRCYHRAVLRAALGVERQRPDDLTALRSRKIIALAVTLWRLSRRSRRNGMRRVVQGFTGAQLAGLSVNHRSGKPCTRSAYVATSWGAERRGPDDCGILEALTRDGPGELAALHASQPPEHLSDPRYLGPPKVIGRDPLGRLITRRFAFAVYWWRSAADPPRAGLHWPK